jgi:flagellar biosynthetic protein FliR
METLVVAFSLVLARVATFIGVLPVLGGSSLPNLVKTTLALTLTVSWFDPASLHLPQGLSVLTGGATSWVIFALALAREALLGLFLGYAFGLFVAPARVAGEYLTQETGLAFGTQVDPTGPSPTGSLTQIFEILASLIFLGLDGHHVFLTVFHSSFRLYPIGGPLPPVSIQEVVAGAAFVEEQGLLLAAPVAFCLFLAALLLVMMARAAPALNLYAVGFPLRLFAGLGAAWILAPNLVAGMVHVLGRATELFLHIW